MKLINGLFTKRSILLLLPLLLFWIVLSPSLSLQSIISGLIVSIIVVFYNLDLTFEEKETSYYSIIGLKKLIVFIGVLLIEMVKANIDVAKIVLSPSMPISPCFVKVPLKLKKDVNKVIYANSITLTPGTLSVDINEKEILVHALTEEVAASMKDNILEKYVGKLEEE